MPGCPCGILEHGVDLAEALGVDATMAIWTAA